jgi:hypothetical protein
MADSSAVNAYSSGKAAAKSGEPFYANPHSSPGSETRAFHEWFAGWCAAMREQEKGE